MSNLPLPPGHVLRLLNDRDSDAYECARVFPDDVRTNGDAMRRGEFMKGTGINLEDAR